MQGGTHEHRQQRIVVQARPFVIGQIWEAIVQDHRQCLLAQLIIWQCLPQRNVNSRYESALERAPHTPGQVLVMCWTKALQEATKYQQMPPSWRVLVSPAHDSSDPVVLRQGRFILQLREVMIGRLFTQRVFMSEERLRGGVKGAQAAHTCS